jgi:hypothetical protein
MSRSYANIITAIWRDADFRALSGEAQRTYLMLVTQPDISAAGTLDLTVRRWAAMASDTKPDDISRTLVVLADARFVVVDEDTEELLVRSFVRHDNGYRNSKRRPAILEAARDARSPLLRQALADEFGRLGLPTGGLGPGPDDPGPHRDRASDRPSRRAADTPTLHESDASDTQPVDKAFAHVEGLSDALCDRPADSNRVVGTKGEYREPPQPTTPTPQPGANLVAEPQSHDHPGNPEEGEANWREDLVNQVRCMRPEWSSRSITRALSWPDVAERPPHTIVAAMLAVARDSSSQHPGRLRADGPWWTTTASNPTGPTIEIPASCGSCGPNRQIELPSGRLARCPNCHPLRAAS